jgi:large subunit ribosomal protein L18
VKSVQESRLARLRRHRRVRKLVRGTLARPRLCVFKSARHIYAQLIDDDAGRTMVTASTLSKDLPKGEAHLKKTEAAKAVGALVAEKALAAGIQQVVFDRGGFVFHGRLKALATAAREKGLKF